MADADPPAAPEFKFSKRPSSSGEDSGGANENQTRLSAVSLQTEAELSEVWDEIGLTAEERAAQLEALLAEVAAVFQKKVAEETSIRQEYVNEVARLEGEIAATAAMVLEPVPEIPSEETATLVRRVAWLNSSLEKLAQVRAMWEQKIGEALEPLHALWEELGEEAEEGFESFGAVLDSERLEAVRAKLLEAQDEKATRSTKISELLDDIADQFAELEHEPESEFDVCIANRSEELGITRDAIQALAHRKEELAEEKSVRTEKLKELGSQIQPLWQKLQVPEERRTAFFASNTGLGMRVIKQCEDELEAMKKLKASKLDELVATARKRVDELWEMNGASGSEKRLFNKTYTSKDITDDLLDAHEAEIERLEMRAELIGPLIASMERFEALYAEREEYEKLILDSSRLLSRKRGSLREEEALRKRVTKDLPKVEKHLRADVSSFEKEHNNSRPWFYNDINVLALIKQRAAQYEEKKMREKEEKKKKKAEKAAAKASRSRAPFAARNGR